MENLEPKKERSPISSLKFQRKSDYKKFRNFIKKETKELKGIEAPKDNKLKSILKVGAGGLGFLALGGLIGAKGKVSKEGSEIFPFAIGRRNTSRPKVQTSLKSFKAPRTPKIGKLLRGTRTTGSVTIPRSRMTTNMINVKPSSAEETAKAERKRLKIKKKLNTIVESKSGKLGGQGVFTQTLEKGVGRPQSKYSTYGSRKRFSKPIIPLDPIEKIIQEAESNLDARKQVLKDSAPERISDALNEIDRPSTKFSKIRRGTRTFSPMDPTKVDPQRITGTLGENKFKGKGSFAKFTRKLFRGNARITKDTSRFFFGKGYKGPKFSLISNVTSNPLVKAGFFILDAYTAYESGKQVVNFKDNIGTALYDLGVQINNEIFKNDPSKLKLYVSESSDENFRVKQVIRNQRINQRKQQASSGNNVIVVPESKQNNQVTTNIPIKTGGTEVSFVPFEPLNNIGTDILLHKLNA